MGAVVRDYPTASKPDSRRGLRPPGAPISRSARIGASPDIPAEQSEVGVVSVYNRSAATVTQGAGLPCKGSPAPSYLAQRQAGQPGGNSEPRELRGFPASVGGARAWTW